MIFKPFKCCAVILLSFSMLVGCVATYHGDGIVVSEKKVINTSSSHKFVKKGAIVGGIVSAVPAMSFGSLIGGVAGAMIASDGVGIISGALIGGVVCGATFGIIGAGVGGGAGFFIERMNRNLSDYSYTVRSLNDAQIITLQQYSVPIAVNTRVKIIKRNGAYFIRKR